jgi:aspartyl-tRNA synthetase
MCEFYQVDLEMSFVEQDDVMHILQKYSLDVAKKFASQKTLKFGNKMPRISYQDAMDDYGIDRPDLRFGMKISDLTEVFTGSGFGVFGKTIASG